MSRGREGPGPDPRAPDWAQWTWAQVWETRVRVSQHRGTTPEAVTRDVLREFAERARPPARSTRVRREADGPTKRVEFTRLTW